MSTKTNNILGLEVVLQAPATLWSYQVLMSRKDSPVNDFEIKVLQELAKRMTPNWKLETINSKITDRFVLTHTLQLRKC